MNDLSHRIRRAAARWLFVELRAHAVAEQYSFGDRTADAVGVWLERTRHKATYRKERRRLTPGGLSYAVNVRTGDKVTTLPPEVRIVEVKISRDDFLGGLRKGQISNDGSGLGAYADYVYLAAPQGIIPIEKLPVGWGLLRFHPDARSPRYALEVVIDPKRLTPASPLSVDPAAFAAKLVQSSMWRLYGYGTDITHTKYVIDRTTYESSERKIVLADRVPA